MNKLKQVMGIVTDLRVDVGFALSVTKNLPEDAKIVSQQYKKTILHVQDMLNKINDIAPEVVREIGEERTERLREKWNVV